MYINGHYKTLHNSMGNITNVGAFEQHLTFLQVCNITKTVYNAE